MKRMSSNAIYNTVSNRSRRGNSAYTSGGMSRNYMTSKLPKSKGTLLSNTSSSMFLLCKYLAKILESHNNILSQNIPIVATASLK